MFFFRYLDVHKSNSQSMVLLRGNEILDGPKVLLAFKSSIVNISTDYANFTSTTEKDILALKRRNYNHYLQNVVQYIFSKSAIRSVVDLDINILKYIIDRLPKEDRDRYLSIQFSQISKDELFCFAVAYAKEIDGHAEYKQIVMGRCDDSNEYQGMINMGNQAEHYVLNYVKASELNTT